MDSVVLFVSPYPHDAAALARLLKPAGFRLDHCRMARDLAAKLTEGRVAAVITEADLADGSWRDVLRGARNASPAVEVVVTAAFADHDLWTRALEAGAFDVIAQPFDDAEVLRIVANAAGAEHKLEHAGAAYFG